MKQDECPFETYEPEVVDIENDADPEEVTTRTKEERFKQVATRRINTILKEMRALSQMAYIYEGFYTNEMVSTMFFTLSNAHDATREAYNKQKLTSNSFTF